MLSGRIAGKALQRAKRSLTSHAALQLLLHFLCTALFQWVRAAARDQPHNREQD